jgi:uncharacterized protein (TIGR02246 family)
MTAHSQTHTAFGREEAWSVIDNFMAAYKNCDATACAAVYTEDATVLPGDRPKATGRKEIEALFTQIFKEGARKLTLTPGEIECSGHLAYEIGIAILELTERDGTGYSDERPYLTVLRQHSNGAWQIQASAWRGAQVLNP